MRIVEGCPVMLEAHRGMSSDCPENTMVSFRTACELGYDMVELDLKYTADQQCVVLHDRTVNRTGRNPDGTQPGEPMPIADLTLAQARELEYGSWKNPVYAGEKLPLLEDILTYSKEKKLPLKLDNVMQTFTPEQFRDLLDRVERCGAQDVAGFTLTEPKLVQAVAERFPNAVIHFDGAVSAETLAAVKPLLRRNPFCVWLPYPTRLNTWCTLPQASPGLVEMVRRTGARLGLWILEDESDLRDACALYHPDIVETTGKIKP